MDHSLAYVRTEDAPLPPPPANLVGVRGWIMANLFSNWSNSILTVLAALFAYWDLSNVLGWAMFRAVWTGDNREACAGEGAGACWPFVQAKFAAMDLRLLSDRPALAGQHLFPSSAPRLWCRC